MRFVLLLLIVSITSCDGQDTGIQTGAEQMDQVISIIYGKNVAVVANHTSLIGDTHLVDTLLSLQGADFHLQKVFAPEHGFRGKSDAGAMVKNQLDTKTGLPIISLYGAAKKPTKEQMAELDLIVFDIQDVGVRFYTYISTLHYVMEACAENNVQLIVLDRPNPNANYVDGPILEPSFKSFIGMHPIPIVYGLTIGELAGMINGEGWLSGHNKCDLKIIPCKNYAHSMEFSLPLKPSPNLPNNHSIRLYPSTCLFEGTVISEGRGTLTPFELYGHPELQSDFSFTPRAIEGMSMSPKFKDVKCFGEDLREYLPEEGWNRLNLQFLLDAYDAFPRKDSFFTSYFESLSGTETLREQIVSGWTEDEIRASWRSGIEEYKRRREKYLIYP